MKNYKTSKELTADSSKHRRAEEDYFYEKREFACCMRKFKAAVGKFDGGYSSARDALFVSQERLDSAQAAYYAAAKEMKNIYKL